MGESVDMVVVVESCGRAPFWTGCIGERERERERERSEEDKRKMQRESISGTSEQVSFVERSSLSRRSNNTLKY